MLPRLLLEAGYIITTIGACTMASSIIHKDAFRLFKFGLIIEIAGLVLTLSLKLISCRADCLIN